MASRLTHAAFVLVLLHPLLLSVSAAAADPEWVDGEWIGGFDDRDGVVFVSATFSHEGSKVAGQLSLPLRSDRALRLDRLAVEDNKLSFDLPGDRQSLRFEGRRSPEGRVKGLVRQGLAAASFELFKVATLPNSVMNAICGNYEIAPGHLVLIARGSSGLIYMDSEGDRLGALYPLNDRTLVAGPSIVAGYPIELTVTFAPPAAGESVEHIVWTRKGEKPRTGARRVFYRTEQIGFQSGNVRLSASLLVPNGPGPHAAVVMVHGSGPVTRDAFWPWADMYARNGIAVLIHDKRGTGASTGSWTRSTFDDLAGDALAGVKFLRRHPEVGTARIGLHGMSLGGWVAPLAASRSSDVAFIIVESAPTVSPIEHERLRVEHQMRADGFPSGVMRRALALMEQKFDVARSGQGWDALAKAVHKASEEGWASYINAPTSLESLQWHWTNVLSFDPTPALARVRCPILALYGALDRIVPPSVHRTRMEAMLAQAGHPDATVKVLDGANHSFLAAVSGGRRESASLRAFVPGYFTTHVSWLNARTGREGDIAKLPLPAQLFPQPALRIAAAVGQPPSSVVLPLPSQQPVVSR